RQQDDLAAVGLGQLERRFERVLVVRVDHRGGRGPVETPVIGAEAFTTGRGVRDRLDENDDSHGWARLRSRAWATGQRGPGRDGQRLVVSARAMTSRWIC